MSFSGMVKEELSKRTGASRHCQIAELAAMYLLCGKLKRTQGQELVLWVQTENQWVARKCFTILQKTFNIETDITVHESAHLKRCRD